MGLDKPSENAFRVIELMRIHQQRAKFVVTAYGTTLTLVEAYVLVEFDLDPAQTLVEIALRLCVDRAAIARATQRLVTLKFLDVVAADGDQRRRIYQLTKKAKTFLAWHDRETTEFLDEHLAPLDLKEISELQRFQHLICDSVGAPPARLRPGEHPFNEGIRRITRALGFINDSLFGSGYSSEEWQILGLLSEKVRTQIELARRLVLSPSTISQLLSRYAGRRWLERKKSQEDARVRELILNNEGERVFRAIEEHGAALIEKAFEQEGPAALARFVEILSKHLAAGIQDEGAVLRPEMRVQVIDNAEMQFARGFLIFHLVRLRCYLKVPSVLLDPSNKSFGLYRGDTLVALAEVEPGISPHVKCFTYSEGVDSPDLLSGLLERITYQLEPRAEVLTLPRHFVPDKVAQRIAQRPRIKLVD